MRSTCAHLRAKGYCGTIIPHSFGEVIGTISAIQMSDATSLALHSMVYMVQAGGELVTVKEMADAMGFSHAHLSKVLQRLVKAGLLESVRGPSGGFRLARPADQVSMLEVYEAIEGPLNACTCFVGRDLAQCPFAQCILGDLPRKLTEDFRSFLESRRLSHFVDAHQDSQEVSQ